MNSKVHKTLKMIIKTVGTFGEVAVGERLINGIDDEGQRIDSVLHLIEGLLEGGFGHKGARLIPKLRSTLANRPLTQWEKERTYGLLVQLLQADGRVQEAHYAFEEAKSKITRKTALLSVAISMNKKEELDELSLSMEQVDLVSLQLKLGQWEECTRSINSIENESERVRAIEECIEQLDERKWRAHLPSLIDCISTLEKRAQLLTRLAEELVARDIVIGAQQLINKALHTAKELPSFERGAVFARLVNVLAKRDRKDEAEELARETMAIASEQERASREGLRELLGLQCAKGGLIELARLVAASEEDEERRGQVECAIVSALLEQGNREAARQVVARINNPDGRVRAGALYVEDSLPVRGPTWALRQVRLILELADMRKAERQSYASLVPILFHCAKDECQQKEAIELFRELLDIVTTEETSNKAA